MAIFNLLKRAELTEYAGLFEANHIDATLARRLDDTDLKEIGITSLGHRRKLLALFAGSDADSPVTERRNVVILFADLVESTRITQMLDAEEAFDLIGAFFDLIDGETAREGGTVERHIGDAVMAVFGAPHAHGDEAVRAVRLSHALHHKMADLGRDRGVELRLRIGLASGPVVMRNDPDGVLSVVGASVNLAARLAASAEPGETLISTAVRTACGAALRTGRSADHMLKGFDDPVSSWQVLGMDERETWTPVGRSSEMRFFRTVLHDLADQKSGRLIILRGEAGIGKTSLLGLWLAMARDQGLTAEMVRVLDFGTTQRISIMARLIEAFLPLADLSETATIWLRTMAGQPLTPDEAALVDAAPPESRALRETEALTALLRGASAKTPLLIAVEDTHWAERQTLILLAHLCRLAAEIPLIIVATTRTEGDMLDDDWRAGIGPTPAWNIDLGPLTPAECRLVARSILGSENDIGTAIARSKGHPLYLEQLLRHGMEDALSGVPPSIQTLIQARVDLLGQADRRAARAAAVLGQTVPPGALQTLLGAPDYDPVALIDRRILQRDGAGLAFHHALIRDCIYTTLLRDERIAFHRAAAAWYARTDPALSADHLARIAAPETARPIWMPPRPPPRPWTMPKRPAWPAPGAPTPPIRPSTCFCSCVRHNRPMRPTARTMPQPCSRQPRPIPRPM
ncbi:MAG: AAA family ATPase [Qingshengfaniella sp.]